MSRAFAYVRVSTVEQTTENQTIAIRRAGYEVEEHRVVSETVSGSTLAMERKEFNNMVENKLEKGDQLVVLKLDRLGRDNIDVQQTINMLQNKGVIVVCLDLPYPDLSKPEGKMMMQMFATFAEFERNRIRERTRQGLDRAKAQGIELGRPKGSKNKDAIQKCKTDGMSQSEAANHLSIGLSTVKRNWNK